MDIATCDKFHALFLDTRPTCHNFGKVSIRAIKATCYDIVAEIEHIVFRFGFNHRAHSVRYVIGKFFRFCGTRTFHFVVFAILDRRVIAIFNKFCCLFLHFGHINSFV